ncbi:MAG: dicarboxylate/amino acid:cation symporter [Cytophagales bacterium]
MKRFPLHINIIFGLILGIIWALLSSYFGWSEFTIKWIDPFGLIFIRLMKLIAVPLVLFSIIQGVSGLSNIGKLGRIGAKTLALYLITTMTAITVGLLIANIVKPGALIDQEQRKVNRKSYESWVAQKDGVEILDGRNLTEAGAPTRTNEEKEEFIKEKMESVEKRKEQGPLQFLVDMVPENIFFSLGDNSLMLQVIFFGIFFGLCLLMIPSEQSQTIISVVSALSEVFLKMVDIVMQAAPFFVFALLAGQVSKMAGDSPSQVVEIFKGLGWYSLCVVLGLGILLFLIYPGVVSTVIKKLSYKNFFRAMSPAQLLAFSSSSSAATLPVTIECVNDNLGVSKEITSFVLPIGATVNMDGTSLYQSVAVLFLAQLHMVDLTLGQQLLIVLTATLASIGSAAVPSAGLIMLIIVLESVGLNPAWIAIIFPVDRILDMCRTVINVTGDATVASIVASTENEINYSGQNHE